MDAGLLRRGGQDGRVLGVDDGERPEPGLLGQRGFQAGRVEMRELVDAAGRQEGLEAEHARPVQGFEVGEVVGDGAAPEAEVDPGLAVGGLPLGFEPGGGGGGGHRVERHVDDRGDAAGGGGPGGGGEALPLGAAGLVDVHVGVDQAGEQGGVAEVGHPVAVGRQGAVGGDPRDLPVPDQHVRGTLAVRQDHPAGADHLGLADGHGGPPKPDEGMAGTSGYAEGWPGA